MRLIASLFHPKLPIFLVYMLQQVEYRFNPYIDWMRYLSAKDVPLPSIMRRQRLIMTNKAKLLVGLLYIVELYWIYVIFRQLIYSLEYPMGFGLTMFFVIFLPVIVVTVSIFATAAGYFFIVKPAEKQLIKQSRQKLNDHPGKVIAIAGSYGKTTMKELLATVLGKAFNVAATPGNGNTPSAHAKFIATLSGDEDYIIFELGEGAPGDVKRFAETLRPEYGIITGLAPNHLDRYGTIDALVDDIMSLASLIDTDKLYITGDSLQLFKYIPPKSQVYTIEDGPFWRVSDVKISFDHTECIVTVDKTAIHLRSSLLGRHSIAPLAFVAAFALKQGMSTSAIEEVMVSTRPYPHRMQPYWISGAMIIDDTYNGNLEGMLAGLDLLDELPADRKVYVTPGLVDQGEETKSVHLQIAEKIAAIRPDLLVLMKNSATDIIERRLEELNYQNPVQIETNPLFFYQNLDQIVKKGDIVLMQNDWTDNYH